MSDAKRATITQLRNEIPFVKHGRDILQSQIDKYNNTVNECLKTFISAYFLDTKVLDTYTNVYGKLCVRGDNDILVEYDCGVTHVTSRMHVGAFNYKDNYLDNEDGSTRPYNIFDNDAAERILNRFLVVGKYTYVDDRNTSVTSDAKINMFTKQVTIGQPPSVYDNVTEEYITIDGAKYPVYPRETRPEELEDFSKWTPEKGFWG